MKILLATAPGITPLATGALIRRLQAENHTVTAAASPRALLRSARQHDLLIFINERPATLLAACCSGRPYVVLASGAATSLRSARRWPLLPLLVRLAYARARKVLVLNTATRDALIKLGVRRQTLTLCAPPAFGPADVSAEQASPPRRLLARAWPGSEPTTAALLRTVARILEIEPGVDLLLLCRDEATLAATEDRLRALSLEAHVELRLDDPAAPLPHAIALAFCTRETTPDAPFAFTALAHGLPLVATRHPLLNDWLKDGDTALLVPPADEPALDTALLRLLQSPTLAQHLRTTALARIASHHNPTTFLTEILAD